MNILYLWELIMCIISSVITQKSESQNGCFKKTMHASFTKIKHFLPSDMHMYEIIVYRKIWPALFS